MFPASPLPQLNAHTCREKWRCDWYLVVDKYEFHVYVGAVCHLPDKSQLRVRCDWHTDSTLTFRPFEFDSLEQNLPLGQSDWFCRLCCVEKLGEGMQQYKLFKFNCRTLSYLILWRVMGFAHDHVYKQFESLHIMCGLEPDQCLSLDEIHRYFAYRRENKTSCVLF
jgi:hypothetical protein